MFSYTYFQTSFQLVIEEMAEQKGKVKTHLKNVP